MTQPNGRTPGTYAEALDRAAARLAGAAAEHHAARIQEEPAPQKRSHQPTAEDFEAARAAQPPEPRPEPPPAPKPKPVVITRPAPAPPIIVPPLEPRPSRMIPLLTIEDTMKILRCSRATLYTLIRRYRLKTVRFGRRRLVRESDLEKWITQHSD